MSQIKPADFSLLLEVFRDGLLLGLITKQEVVNWADGIIRTEDEGAYLGVACGPRCTLIQRRH